ncbi:MAG: hypothetical protein K1X79_01720 [Oligoflexia bacterium]|nr:hypothetical protein [Oligoflexia bacterium]
MTKRPGSLSFISWTLIVILVPAFVVELACAENHYRTMDVIELSKAISDLSSQISHSESDQLLSFNPIDSYASQEGMEQPQIDFLWSTLEEITTLGSRELADLFDNLKSLEPESAKVVIHIALRVLEESRSRAGSTCNYDASFLILLNYALLQPDGSDAVGVFSGWLRSPCLSIETIENLILNFPFLPKALQIALVAQVPAATNEITKWLEKLVELKDIDPSVRRAAQVSLRRDTLVLPPGHLSNPSSSCQLFNCEDEKAGPDGVHSITNLSCHELPTGISDSLPGKTLFGNYHIKHTPRSLPFPNRIRPTLNLIEVTNWKGFASNGPGKSTLPDLSFNLQKSSSCWEAVNTGQRILSLQLRDSCVDELQWGGDFNYPFAIDTYDMAAQGTLIARSTDFRELKLEPFVPDADKDKLPDQYETEQETFDGGRIIPLDPCTKETIVGVKDAEGDRDLDIHTYLRLKGRDREPTLSQISIGDGISEFGEYRGFITKDSGRKLVGNTLLREPRRIADHIAYEHFAFTTLKPLIKQVGFIGSASLPFPPSLSDGSAVSDITSYTYNHGAQVVRLTEEDDDPFTPKELGLRRDLAGAWNFLNNARSNQETPDRYAQAADKARNCMGLECSEPALALTPYCTDVENSSGALNDYYDNRSTSGPVANLPTILLPFKLLRTIEDLTKGISNFPGTDFTQAVFLHEENHQLAPYPLKGHLERPIHFGGVLRGASHNILQNMYDIALSYDVRLLLNLDQYYLVEDQSLNWSGATTYFGQWELVEKIGDNSILQNGFYRDSESCPIWSMESLLGSSTSFKPAMYFVPQQNRAQGLARFVAFTLYKIESLFGNPTHKYFSEASIHLSNRRGDGGSYSEASATVILPATISQRPQNYQAFDVKRRVCGRAFWSPPDD